MAETPGSGKADRLQNDEMIVNDNIIIIDNKTTVDNVNS